MSFATDLRALLLADAGVTALVGQKVASDRIEQGTVPPFIVFTQSNTEFSQGLDGTLLASRAVFDVQVWAATRLSADAVADACQAVFVTADRALLGRSSGYDAELDLEATTITIEWWD